MCFFFVTEFLYFNVILPQGFVWQAMASLYYPENYNGQHVGDVDVTFDLSTAQARFANLSIDDDGYQYILQV